MSARTVSEWLRACTPEFLTELLLTRPDLGVPVPSDFASLAARASTPPSARRAMESLNAFELEALEALAANFLTARSTEPQTIASDIGVTVKQVQPALERFTALLLTWGDPVKPVAGVSTALPFGQSVRDLYGASTRVLEGFSPDKLDAAFIDLPEDELEVLRALRANPIGTVRSQSHTLQGLPCDLVDAALTPQDRLFAKGLLARHGSTTVQMPAEVGAALRRKDKRGKQLQTPAKLTSSPLKIKDIDNTGAIEAGDRVRQLTEILESWGACAPGVLRGGGLGVRDVKAASKAAEIDEALAVLLLECAMTAGLIAASDDFEPTWRPTSAFDAWRAQDSAVQWVAIAQGWLDSDRTSADVFRKDATGKSPNALAPGLENAGAKRARLDALKVLADAPEGTPAKAVEVGAVLAWQLPMRRSRFGEELLGDALHEAGLLGITARGAITTYGKQLIAGDEVAAIADSLGACMPREVDHVVIQADLSALAPGPLKPELHRELMLLADLESRGAASLWRFSTESVRRAFDAGRVAHEVHDFLKTLSSTEVPQALTYLVDDVSRRHGSMRVGTAGAYIRTDDSTLLTEVVASTRTASLGLRLLAPTVAVSQATGPRVLEVLRSAGYAPMAEAADGAVLIGRADVLRAPAPRRSPRPASRGLSREQAALAIELLMKAAETNGGGKQTVGSKLTDRSSAATLAFLQEALDAKSSVWIGFVGRDGKSRDGVYTPVFIGGGRVLANDGRTDHVLPVHLITGVAPLEDAQ